MAYNNNKRKVDIDALKTDIRSFKELITDQSNTMASLKILADSLNIMVKGGYKTISFANRTNTAFQRPTQYKNWIQYVGAVYAQLEPAGIYDINPRFSSLL